LVHFPRRAKRLCLAYNLTVYGNLIQAKSDSYLQVITALCNTYPEEGGDDMARTLREIVGERIVLLRRRKGWTQPELALKAGMGITTLNRVENAHASMTMEKVVALAKILGTSTDYLLGLSDDPGSERMPAAPALSRV
jgi:ribosome-binding protein aMBF1 (putative translation factor)